MILFYVSGHGLGHATRTRAVIDALQLPVIVRTEAPRWVFGPLVQYQNAGIDFGVVERGDALTVDMEATSVALARFTLRLPEIVERESEFVRANGIRLIAADAPFAAGLIARNTGVPAVCLGNFLWTWILDRHATPVMREGYAGFSLAMRYPLHHTDGWDMFPRVIDVPLVTPRSSRPRAEIRRELGLPDGRIALLVGGRAVLGDEVLRRVEESCPDLTFLRNDAVSDYHDLIRAADVVVSKLGYSIAAECIAERKAVLYPPRRGFREDPLIQAALPGLTKALEIPEDEWRSGHWKPWLDRLLALPDPPDSANPDGAVVCATILREILQQTGL